jgi:hypothetical protein
MRVVDIKLNRLEHAFDFLVAFGVAVEEVLALSA